MESPEDEDDLKLAKASAGLLSDLESALPKLLWRPSKSGNEHGRVHEYIRRRDLEYVVKLIEPFQGEPQLLDARLKHILPPIVNAYGEYLRPGSITKSKNHLDFQDAICVILYTLCKVRGCKVILGFLNNEPRLLDPVLSRIEEIINAGEENEMEWQVPYILLLWLSHLLLTPFDLASISDAASMEAGLDGISLPPDLPPIAYRALKVGLNYLPATTKAQDGAAMLLVRLVTRPDMQKIRLGDALVAKCIDSLKSPAVDTSITIYQRLGPLRFLSSIAACADLALLVPTVYVACQELLSVEESPLISNAVAKKLIVKIFRNIAILSLRSASTEGPLLNFLETSSVLEDVIDYLLRSLGDRDTPVRYATAKALSLIILELEPAMGHEVIQAVLDTFKEDMPQTGDVLNFQTVNALKWHGLTLALAHTLFKRSTAPEQLPEIINALVSALQFEQRTATGGSIGVNVRDAANFGIWSLSRRYATKELLSVYATAITLANTPKNSVIQSLAMHLILSACLDPSGNIRRGSSAALQELIGRHPDEIHDGIALVQIVDYQAVGLRARAMVDVANQAARLHEDYWEALLNALLEWRGLGSQDVPSREAAAESLKRLTMSRVDRGYMVLERVMDHLQKVHTIDLEALHGLILTLAQLIVELYKSDRSSHLINGQHKISGDMQLNRILDIILATLKDSTTRLLRSELPVASTKLLAALCISFYSLESDRQKEGNIPFPKLAAITQQLLSRREDPVLGAIPSLVRSLLLLMRQSGEETDILSSTVLGSEVTLRLHPASLRGAGKVIALGALAPHYLGGINSDESVNAIRALAHVVETMDADWRVVAIKALQLAVEGVQNGNEPDPDLAKIIRSTLHAALNDYTIDERGDIGSLVRLQGIACTAAVLARQSSWKYDFLRETLQANIYRLSLEKLDRVRLAAAQCRAKYIDLKSTPQDNGSVSSCLYFAEALAPLAMDGPEWKHQALLHGCISCAGKSAEPLLQASRQALVRIVVQVELSHLLRLIDLFASILKSLQLDNGNILPALELLAFLLDMQIPQRLKKVNFKWRNLLSTVQKSHHKSNDIPKILAAVHVYLGLADIDAVRGEVLKKLIGMLKTNPYPAVRSSVAEALFVITGDEVLKDRNWTKPPSQCVDAVKKLEERHLKTLSL